MIERDNTTIAEPHALHERTPITKHSLSVNLPAYNKARVIANTVSIVHLMLDGWKVDFEIIVVNDGSTDQTGAILIALAASDTRIRFVTHPLKQSYGATLVSGFAAATKELTFFMDADRQFDIRDLRTLFLFIDRNDAVIGYRLDRQDSLVRKLNSWGWRLLIGWVRALHVRDVDCAFKLLHTLMQSGGIYKELCVHHLLRKVGRATGTSRTRSETDARIWEQ
jgi:glycosyltransferase involved in cell wall biosynthesis